MKAKTINYENTSIRQVKDTYDFLKDAPLEGVGLIKYEENGHTIIEPEYFFQYEKRSCDRYDTLDFGFRIDETDKTITFIATQHLRGEVVHKHLTLKTDEINRITDFFTMPFFIYLKDGRVIGIIKTEKNVYDTPADFYLLQPLSSVHQ